MLKLVSPRSAEEEQIVGKTIGCGIEVHRVLGAGFREHIYARAFQLELESRGMRFECEKAIDVTYKKWKIPGQRIDLIVENVVVVELKRRRDSLGATTEPRRSRSCEDREGDLPLSS
jgi:GxxExxY protein